VRGADVSITPDAADQPFVPLMGAWSTVLTVARRYTCLQRRHLRSDLLDDWMRRTFELLAIACFVKNITDVGHMRQDAVDRGRTKVSRPALERDKTPMEIARHYEAAFRDAEASSGPPRQRIPAHGARHRR